MQHNDNSLLKQLYSRTGIGAGLFLQKKGKKKKQKFCLNVRKIESSDV